MPETAVQDVSRSYEIYITLAVTMSALVLTTALRVFGKLKYGLSLGWDDHLMVLGTVRLCFYLCRLHNRELSSFTGLTRCSR